MISLDFETYYDKEISVSSKECKTHLSPEAYIEALFNLHRPPYLVSLYSRTQQYSGSLAQVPWDLFEKFVNPKIICCHNARFDQAVFKACAERGLVPKEWLTKEWICTADLAVYHQAPRNLAGACKVLLDIEVDKDLRKSMKGVDYETLDCDKKEALRQYCLRDAELCFLLAEKYLPLWPESERTISRINRDAGMYGITLNEEFISSGIQKLHQIKFDAEKKLPWRENSDVDTAVLSTREVVKLCQQNGIPIPTRLNEKGDRVTTMAQSEPEVVAWEQEYGQKYPWVAAMRDYRKANILLEKLKTMQRHSVKGTLYFSLLYFGAHTGRFSGSGGLNMQNLPGRKQSFVSLRSALVARPGKELCIIDWCQIEPRILRWAAKDQEALDLLARGISIYEAYAIQHFGWVKRGQGWAENGQGIPLKKADPPLYGLAKAAVLGAGYGCGPVKYKVVAKNMADIDLTPEEAASQIALFRRSNPKVVALWNHLAFCVRLAASRRHDFEMKLPSGRKLYYFRPSLLKGLTAFTDRDLSKITFLHGGKLTENYVQAVARDVFVLGLTRLAEAHFQNLFHVHDEYVLELDKGVHVDQEEILREVILAPIPWLSGCPLDVEFKWRSCYG